MKNIFYYLCLSFFILACEDIQEQNELESNFYALTVGNSWVYRNYRYNSTSDTYTDSGIVDSVSIVGAEKINENIFYKFRRLTTGNDNNNQIFKKNGEYFEFLRDSSGVLVNELGQIIHTSIDYQERLLRENDWGDLYEKLSIETEELHLESGTFNCVVTERYAKSKEGEKYPSTDYIYYSDGFGFIYETISFISSDTLTALRRLDSYEIN
ncbi:MAG: hypothetical protein ABJL44_15135 [Algibacter sp.]